MSEEREWNPQKTAATYLQGLWNTAIRVELLSLLGSAILFAFEIVALLLTESLPYITPIHRESPSLIPLVILFGILALDLLLISPLKAGRILFYETLTADKESARLSLLFRYYQHGYFKAVWWRTRLWIVRAVWIRLLLLPSSLLFTGIEALSRCWIIPLQGIFTLILTVIGVALLLGGWITAEILLLKNVPVPYLLSKTRSVGDAFRTAHRATKHCTNTLVTVYARYVLWIPSFLLVIPYFWITPLFQVSRALTVRKQIFHIPPINVPHTLQHGKKHGKISHHL